jgi:hypothetical protein
MKTIEVSDEMYAKLIELATEMTTQDPRCTRMPHMFQVREEYDQIVPEGFGDEYVAVDFEGGEIKDLQELKDMTKEIMVEKECDTDEFEELDFADDWDGVMDILEVYSDDNWTLFSIKKEHRYSNTFFTAKACKEHIESNGYHYNNPTDYLNSAWRNPEMELVSEFLCNLVGKSNHK